MPQGLQPLLGALSLQWPDPLQPASRLLALHVARLPVEALGSFFSFLFFSFLFLTFKGVFLPSGA